MIVTLLRSDKNTLTSRKSSSESTPLLVLGVIRKRLPYFSKTKSVEPKRTIGPRPISLLHARLLRSDALRNSQMSAKTRAKGTPTTTNTAGRVASRLRLADRSNADLPSCVTSRRPTLPAEAPTHPTPACCFPSRLHR